MKVEYNTTDTIAGANAQLGEELGGWGRMYILSQSKESGKNSENSRSKMKVVLGFIRDNVGRREHLGRRKNGIDRDPASARNLK